MKNYYINLRQKSFLGILGLLTLLSGCSKSEEKIIPTSIPEYGYHLPQGNNSYDTRILDYYDRWGTYVLYKFSNQDFIWQVISNDRYYTAIPSDEAYIDKQLDLLETVFFNYYPDSTLRKYLPGRFFLCSSLNLQNKRVDAYALTSTFTGGYENFAVNWGSQQILKINAVKDSTSVFRGNVNFSFLKIMDLSKRMTQSDAFLNTSNYLTPITPTSPAMSVTTADRYKRGFLGSGGGTIPTAQNDWYAYLQIILTNSYTQLTNPETTATNATAIGILSPVKDVNGVVRRKYDAMISHYKENYNIDLQAIGNGE